MDSGEEDTAMIEASGGESTNENNNNNNNNNGEERYSKGTGVRKKETDILDNEVKNNERKKRFFHQYIYQQDYQEALRSLLWEPYDCRENSNSWYYSGLDDSFGANASNVPKRKSISSSESSLSLSSSYSSLDEILTIEMTQKSALTEQRYSLNMETPKEMNKRISWPVSKRQGREVKPLRTKEERTLLTESKLTEEDRGFNGGISESRCTTDPVQKRMNIEIMVSDLDTQNGEVVSLSNEHCDALASSYNEICASASQCEFGCCEEECLVCAREEDVLKNSVDTMLVTVEGTLEPRDSNEGTQLVSPDTSLDINDSPVRLTGRNNRVEPGPSGGNVSVVNCYRAVPVAVVSTVPTIKCLNTQENVSNVNIIQTSSNPDQRLPKRPQNRIPQPQPKRIATRPNNNAPTPSTSKTRPKVQPRDPKRMQNRPHSTALEQNRIIQVKNDRVRPKSTNVDVEHVGQSTQTPLRPPENPSTSVLSSHNRSVSNPVLGNQFKTSPNRFGSQQNIPIRLETHFGPNSPDGTEQAQTFVTARSASSDMTPKPLETNTIVVQNNENNNETPKPSPRTFTSTEAQTDDVPLGIPLRSASNREQRRRERRERRHQRRLHQSVLNSGSVWQTNVDTVPRDGIGLPDILNSHMPPPYSAVSIPAMPPPVHMPPQQIPVAPGPQPVPHLVEPPAGSPPPHSGNFRFPFPFPGSGRRFRGQMYLHEEETPKSCCGVVVTQTVSIRWFIVMIAFVGICCVIVGTVLGAMKASGREHLTVSLLMIGVGIVLVTVSGVAWRLTSQDAPSCRSMLGLGGGDDSATEPNRRFVPRMPPSYGRPHHPYAAMMYPEFQYRPPPPSYQASMQEYRLRLLLLERPNGNGSGMQGAASPPPTYRSQAGSTLGLRAPTLCRSLPQSEYSHPPSYRSRTSSTRPTLDPNGGPLGSVNHSRDPSLISHVSDQNGNVTQAVVNVISVMGNTVDLHQGETDLQIDGIKLGVDEDVPIPPLRMLLNKGKGSSPPGTTAEDTKSDNVNLVTIVTVSDNNSSPNRDHSVESDVLAHL